MDRSRSAVYGTLVITALVVVASGPLVAAVDFTRERTDDRSPFGTGSAQVTVESVPSVVWLDRGAYGARSYYLRVPDATVRIGAVVGDPFLVYTVRIPALGYAHGSVYALDRRTRGPMTLSLEPDAFDPTRVDRRTYSGTLTLTLRNGEDERVLHREPLTVEVDR